MISLKNWSLFQTINLSWFRKQYQLLSKSYRENISDLIIKLKKNELCGKITKEI